MIWSNGNGMDNITMVATNSRTYMHMVGNTLVVAKSSLA